MTTNQNQAVQKSTNGAPGKPKALEVMAARLNVDAGKLTEALKKTVFAKATDEEFLTLVVVANEYQLNPMLKELYAFPAKGGGIVPVVGIDGWVKIINRSEGFDGLEFSFQDGEDGDPVSCTGTMYIKGRTRPMQVTEYFSECYRETEPWKKMPHRMLRHKTLIQLGRVACGLSGIHDEDEAIDISSSIVSTDEPQPRKARSLTPPAPRETAPPAPSAEGLDIELSNVLDEAQASFLVLRKWGEETGNIPNADSYGTLEDIPAEVVRRLLRNKSGLVAALKGAKELLEAK